MSDNARKGFGEQIQEKVTPDSQKTYTEQAGEKVTGAYDKAAATIQPTSEKSTTQKLGDGTRSNADTAQNEGKGYVQAVQDTAGDVAKATSEKLKAASGYVSGTGTDKPSGTDKTW